MEQKVSHIIAEMPTDAQCCPAQIFNVLFYVVCFPRAWAVLGSAGPRDAVTLCPVPSVPGVPMSLVCAVSSVQRPVSTPGQHCTLLCTVQAVTLYEWLTSIAGSVEVTLGHLSQWWWFRMFLFIDLIQVDVSLSPD